ncbi:MAG: nitroreductase family protein [Barnesiella sp.]
MKRYALFLAGLIIPAISTFAQTIKLPEPQKTGGKPLMEVLSQRQSTRDFDTSRTLSDQTLSNLLWAGFGYNREGKRTAPSAMNRQEIAIYIITSQSTFIYDASLNELKEITKGDYRKAAGSQDFVYTAPVNLVFVCDKTKMPNIQRLMPIADLLQNIYLYCASECLGTVVRGSFDKNELSRILKLNENQEILLCQTIGYPKK